MGDRGSGEISVLRDIQVSLGAVVPTTVQDLHVQKPLPWRADVVLAAVAVVFAVAGVINVTVIAAAAADEVDSVPVPGLVQAVAVAVAVDYDESCDRSLGVALT